MKVKTKILLSILPLFFIGIIVTNIAFGMFFQNFIQSTEQDRIHSSASFITVYLSERLDEIQNTVNDWAHWDDTFYFIEDLNVGYVENNLTASAMSALDVNFLLFFDWDETMRYALYYNSDNGEISDLSSDFYENIQTVLDYSRLAEDTKGILKIGSDYYFVASSAVTDSVENVAPNGTLIFGKEIDNEIIAKIEDNSSMRINSLSLVKQAKQYENSKAIEFEYDATNRGLINAELSVLNHLNPNASIAISMTMPRDLYMKAMDQVFEFSMANTLYSVISLIGVFYLLSKLVKNPFATLLKDVQSIDLAKSSFNTISENGKDEFAYLRKAINILMDKVMKGQNELADSRNELHTTLMSIGDGIITVDRSGAITFMNPAAEQMIGESASVTLGKQIEDVLVILNDEGQMFIENPAYQVFEAETTIKLSNNVKLRSVNDVLLTVEITAAPIKKFDGDIIGCVLALNDVSESREKQKQIEYLSYQDILTGAYNRFYYEKKMLDFETESEGTISLIIVDVNGLKLTNDAFGHQTGDRLLIKVVENIKKSIRAQDMVFRIGGDEFVVILNQAKVNEVEHVYSRLLSTIESEKIMNIPISASIGWGVKQSTNEKMESVFKQAEDMMYRNKASDNKSLRHQTIQIIMKTLFEKNPREEEHSKRVSKICLKIGEKMELDASRLKNLYTAGLLHDIGKIGVENTYLDKAGSLNDEEWKEIRKHPQISHNILSSVNDYAPLADIVLSHHERWDGNGYPNGLTQEEIPIEARIIAVADAYDAMTSNRSYRKAIELEEVIEEFKRYAGTQFDPEIVEVFLHGVLCHLVNGEDCL